MPLNDSVELTDELSIASPFNPEEMIIIGEERSEFIGNVNAILSEMK